MRDKRIRILTDDEMDALYSRPQFTDEERAYFFELNHDEESLLGGAVNIARKVYTIILLGYFKAKQQIFQFDLEEAKDDAQYVLKRYFLDESIGKTSIGREARRLSQQSVLQFTGYRMYSHKDDGDMLIHKAQELCRISIDPLFIFRELLAVIAQQKMTLPGYTTLQEHIISNALQFEQARISEIFKLGFSVENREKIFSLFEQSDGFYAITILKKDPKNFRLTAIRKEIAQHRQYRPLYEIAASILPSLGISKNAISYYASLVEHYTVRGLNRMEQDQSCLWLLCFIYHRFQNMIDNIAAMFIYTANQYESAVVEKAQELFLKQAMEPSEKDLKIAKLLRFYTDQSIAETQPFGTIRNNAYVILPASKIDQIAAELEDKTQKEKSLKVFYWQAVDLLSKTYKPPLRALLQALSLEGEQHKALQKACKFLQAGLGSERGLSGIQSEDFPQQFMGVHVKDFIYDTATKNLNLNRYEYECYRQVANSINGRSLFVNNSSRYRSLDSELLQNWQQNKSAVLKKVNRPLLNFPLQQFIDEKAKPLDDKIILINEAINNGENAYLKVKLQQDGSKIWTLPYTKKSEDLNNPFYEKLPPVNIIRVLQFVNQNTQFMREFTHIKPHYAKSRQDELSIYGFLIANGTNLGIMKMAGLCDCPLSSLETTDKNFIRLATLRAANDVVSNHIAKLSIFRHWNINPNLLHASLDGTKISTERETLLSRYSPKYFGLDKGCVDYLLNANHVPINAMVIGANEHESHFLFDLIYNNTSEIQPDIFSTDTEGSNQLNFLLLHLIEKLYAPRYRSLSTKTESIVSFSSPEKFKDLLIKPQRQLSQKLILNEEDNIQHILASLLMGETKQSNIVAKLSSKQFASRTKQALWEMNAILMTDHLLNSIGDVGFRQSIQAALNRGEAYNQLRRHVERVNGRSIRGVNQSEVMAWSECTRLLTNCAIYYNAALLNRLFEKAERNGDVKLCEFIKHLSPVAWTHINFQGKYELFLQMEGEAIDLDAMILHFENFKFQGNKLIIL